MPARENSQAIGIELIGLKKGFNTTSILETTDCKIAPGQFLSLLGPSGSGKSTLLRLIAGVEKPSAGSVKYDGNLVAPRFSISFVFQDAQLLPWRTVYSNVLLPLEFLGLASSQARSQVEKTLEKVGLKEAKDLYPNQLSGGMKMRASLARALVTQPKILLLDEPFSALDEVTRFKLQEELLALWHEQGFTVVFVTHAISEAVYLSERVLLLSQMTRRFSDDIQVDLGRDRKSHLRMESPYLSLVRTLQEKFKELGGPI